MSTLPPPAWIALTAGGPLAALGDIAGVHSYRSTDDPRQFAELLRSTRPRIVLLGTPPSGPDELDVALHERRRRPSLRVVVVSPSAAIDDRLEALRAGADEAHADTMDPLELVARLTILEERTRARHETVLAVTDETEIDLVAHEVRRAGQVVRLRPKEFQLLAMLAAHPGRAYTRRQLLDRVWGPGHAGDPRTVDVHIRWLRSKLEARPDAPEHLVTVRGVGYRLDAIGR
jgi:two-component system alkaline phosphatase synthesis response regulator PhoP